MPWFEPDEDVDLFFKFHMSSNKPTNDFVILVCARGPALRAFEDDDLFKLEWNKKNKWYENFLVIR